MDPEPIIARTCLKFGVEPKEMRSTGLGRQADAYVSVARAECVAALVLAGMSVCAAGRAIGVSPRGARHAIGSHEARFGEIERKRR